MICGAAWMVHATFIFPSVSRPLSDYDVIQVSIAYRTLTPAILKQISWQELSLDTRECPLPYRVPAAAAELSSPSTKL